MEPSIAFPKSFGTDFSELKLKRFKNAIKIYKKNTLFIITDIALKFIMER
jgi:hypothetical protein